MKKTFTNHSLTMLRRALGYGILVTMASGLYVILREHRMARQSDAKVIAGQPHPPEI